MKALRIDDLRWHSDALRDGSATRQTIHRNDREFLGEYRTRAAKAGRNNHASKLRFRASQQQISARLDHGPFKSRSFFLAMASVERRIADDGRAYSKLQFQVFYTELLHDCDAWEMKFEREIAISLFDVDVIVEVICHLLCQLSGAFA